MQQVKNRMNRKLLTVGLLSAMITGSAQTDPCTVNTQSHAAVTPVPRHVEWWTGRHKAVLERISQGNVGMLMIGDSITQGWSTHGKDIWNKYYAPRNAVNLGFGGDRTQNVLWRLQNGEIDNISPKLAVLMIGTNNSNGDDNTPEQIADGIKAIVCALRNRLPHTKILILGIFPRGSAEQRANMQANATYHDQWAKNDKASQLAARLADENMIFFLDINKTFLKDGVLTREILPDLLHPQEKAYRLWADAMEPKIVELLGETK